MEFIRSILRFGGGGRVYDLNSARDDVEREPLTPSKSQSRLPKFDIDGENEIDLNVKEDERKKEEEEEKKKKEEDEKKKEEEDEHQFWVEKDGNFYPNQVKLGENETLDLSIDESLILEIMEIFRFFSNGKKVVTYDSFSNLLKNLNCFENFRTRIPPLLLRRWFGQLEKRQITFPEFASSILLPILKISQSDMSNNNEMKIQEKENKSLRNVNLEIKEFFEIMDQNNDGLVDLDEIVETFELFGEDFDENEIVEIRKKFFKESKKGLDFEQFLEFFFS